MVVFLIRALIFLASAALGLWIASLVVDGFTVGVSGFLVAVVVFAVLQSILTPWFLVMTRRYATALTGAVGLVSTVVALFVATLVGEGLTIRGLNAWVLGSLVVWIVTMLGTLLLPLVFLRNRVQQRRRADA
ncbi:phage holin family protein [uncultured Cellulomonas sp.]|uniref:phage holin family protein n=1 Tax=uncultured Cellulomonas sp. TaxID=189682 RepID=UPI0028EFFA73|nr:phage holin family protein [uncultured Cellulomonas sp.]